MKQINIACEAPLYLPYDKLNYFQGELKSLSKENYEKLRNEIVETGFAFPIHAWLDKEEDKYWIIGGHQRFRAIKQMVEREGFESPELPIVPIHAPNKKAARRRILQDVSQYGKIDEQGLYEFALTAELDLEDLKNFDMPGIDLEDFEKEFFDLEEGPVEGEDDIPENVPAKTKVGDLYQLGEHRLLCGDSTSKLDVERLMNSEKADMVFTDPPYNQPESGGKNDLIGKALHKQTASISHLINFEPEQFLKVLPNVFNGNLNAYIFTSKDLLPDYLQWAKSEGYSWNVLVWKKPTAIPIGGSHRPDIEYLLVFRKSGIFNSGIGNVNYSKVIECSRDNEGLHPTMKPVEIIENQLKIGSNEKGLVADLFGGSGSTLIACEKTKRKCYMMELDPHYCDVIVARWEQFTGKKAELIK